MKKITVVAGSDVALVKYWGKKNEKLRLAENGSLSIVLDKLFTTTTVEFNKDYKEDKVTIGGEKDKLEVKRVVKHLDRIRQMAGVLMKAKVVSKSNFPKSTGLSSSGSGFAALTVAGVKALDLKLNEKELSQLARLGSGSACRCVCGGFVYWKAGETSETSYARQVFSTNHWDICDLVAVVGGDKKQISSTMGHKNAKSSLFYKERLKHVGEKIEKVIEAIDKKDFTYMGELIEAEALEFHSILLTSKPSIIVWQPGTLEVIKEVQRLRKEEGVSVFFTISTGFNVHILTLPKYKDRVEKAISGLKSVKKVLISKVGGKPREISDHLF